MHSSLASNVPIRDSDTETSVSTIKNIYDQVLDSSAQLSSDMVGHLGLIDFSSSRLRNELDEEELNEITQIGVLPPISITTHVQELIKDIKNIRPASACIREILHKIGN
ncbi:hypothetical protein CU097_006416 [Rhizopus azygosporus]|uniref:Uncharacterized protein n=1 Tax=Rhizopus azygosporus TaxID=86630 RepID=A0A367JCF8_RHIAZ|nr:hypothetical protein CU097_006416 [Rhizopus azygosporus]